MVGSNNMMTSGVSYGQAPVPGNRLRVNRVTAILFPELGAAITSAALLCAWIGLSEEASFSWALVAFKATVQTLSGALIGLALLLVAEIGIITVFVKFVAYRWRIRVAFTLFIVFLFGALAAINSLPVVLYVEMVDAHLMEIFALPLYVGSGLALMTANGMLLFFVHGLVTEVWGELREIYVISARFRDGKEIDAVREKLIWLFLSHAVPLFYFIFSFTLFCDILFQNRTYDEGIVGALFREITEQGFTDRFWVDLLSMLVPVLVVRMFIALPSRYWEARIGVAAGRSDWNPG
jgi:hypothetical protein